MNIQLGNVPAESTLVYQNSTNPIITETSYKKIACVQSNDLKSINFLEIRLEGPKEIDVYSNENMKLPFTSFLDFTTKEKNIDLIINKIVNVIVQKNIISSFTVRCLVNPPDFNDNVMKLKQALSRPPHIAEVWGSLNENICIYEIAMCPKSAIFDVKFHPAEDLIYVSDFERSTVCLYKIFEKVLKPVIMIGQSSTYGHLDVECPDANKLPGLFNKPAGLSVLGKYKVVVCDHGCLRQVDIFKGSLTTICGNPGNIGLKDGIDKEASLTRPSVCSLSYHKDHLYFYDTNSLRSFHFDTKAVVTFKESLPMEPIKIEFSNLREREKSLFFESKNQMIKLMNLTNNTIKPLFRFYQPHTASENYIDQINYQQTQNGVLSIGIDPFNGDLFYIDNSKNNLSKANIKFIGISQNYGSESHAFKALKNAYRFLRILNTSPLKKLNDYKVSNLEKIILEVLKPFFYITTITKIFEGARNRKSLGITYFPRFFGDLIEEKYDSSNDPQVSDSSKYLNFNKFINKRLNFKTTYSELP